MQSTFSQSAFFAQVHVSGNTVRLPDVELPKKVYNSHVKTPLEKLGGAWSGKLQCWVFPADPAPRIQELIEGKGANLKSDFHFFETPTWLTGGLFHFAEEAGLKWHQLQRDCRVLEPGAGRGSLLKSAHFSKGFTNLFYYELMPENRQILESEIRRLNLPAQFMGEDFMKGTETGFDMVLANPPFKAEKPHILQMLEVLSPGGLLLTITSPKLYNDEKFQKQLTDLCEVWQMREFESDKDDPIFEGTNIGCCFLVARKLNASTTLF